MAVSASGRGWVWDQGLSKEVSNEFILSLLFLSCLIGVLPYLPGGKERENKKKENKGGEG